MDNSEIFKVFIEIPKGNVNNKYEYDHKSGKIVSDFVFENLTWPYNYGFIPNTKSGDGEELDALVLSENPLTQGAEVKCTAIGMLEVLDRGEADNKIICVSVEDAFASKYCDISELSSQEKEQFINFQKELARQKKKIVEVKGFKSKEIALEEIKSNKI